MITVKDLNLKEHFSSGINFLDEEFEEIFERVQNIADILDDEDKIPMIKDNLRIISQTTEKHFFDEESYMRFEGKSRFLFHKHCHDKIRDDIIPVLKDLSMTEHPEKDDIRKYLGIYLGSLAAHILFEDSSLKDKKPVSLNYPVKKEKSDLEKAAGEILKENLNIKYEISSSSSPTVRDYFAYERIYNINDAGRIKVTAFIENRLIASFLKDVFKFEKEADKFLTQHIICEFTKEAGCKLAREFKDVSLYENESEKILSCDEAHKKLTGDAPFKLCFDFPQGKNLIYAEKC